MFLKSVLCIHNLFTPYKLRAGDRPIDKFRVAVIIYYISLKFGKKCLFLPFTGGTG